MNKEKFTYIFTIIITLFVGIVGTLIVNNVIYNGGNISKTFKNVSIKEENSIKESIAKVYDSVILVETYDNEDNQSGSGTGFIYKKDEKNAYILTNHHVVDGANSIQVTTTNADTIDAKYLGSDEYTDLAVLSIDAKYASQVASIGNSSNMEIGDTVFTVGSPLGQKYMGTVTKGILSGKDRQVTVKLSNGNYIMDVLQTDAAINPGNSGGPLVNINGEVIAITSMKLVQDEIEGMGFGLPIEVAMSYVDRLKKGETIERPLLGVKIADIDYAKYLSRQLGLEIDSKIEKGAVILEVEDNSLASKAGIKKGDIITKINENDIEDTAHFRYNLYKYSIGDEIKITYSRNGKEKNVNIKLTRSLEK